MATPTDPNIVKLTASIDQLNRNLGSGNVSLGGGGGTTTLPGITGGTSGGIEQFIPPEYQSGMQSFKKSFTEARKEMKEFFSALDDIDKAAGTIVEPLRAVSEDIQKTFGGFSKFSEPIRNEVGQDIRESYDMFAETFVKSANELRDASQEKYVLETDGTEINILSDIFKDASEYQYRFTGMIEDYKNTYGPMMAEGLKDNAADIALFQENFNLSSTQLGDFIAVEVAKTGEATTTMMDDLRTFSYGLSAQTGISAKLIAEDTVKIVSNVEKFGNVTVEEAARMSTALKQLGVDYSQLDGMVGQFQSFDTAATKVGELSAVFGIHLDAVEMMNLANTDQEAMMHKLRDAFDESGQSLDDMNIAQKNLLKEQAGFSDVKQMEMFFSGQVDSMEELQEMTDEAATEESAADAVKAFNKDLADLSLQGVTAAERVDKMTNDMIYSMRSIAPEIGDFRASMQTGIAAFGGEVTQVVDRSFVAIDKIKNASRDAVVDGDFSGLGKNLMDGFESVLSEGIPQAFSDTFLVHLPGIFNNSHFFSSSPSKIGLNLASGILDVFPMITDAFSLMLQEMNILAINNSEMITETLSTVGLQDINENLATASVTASTSITEILSQYQEKLEEVQQITDAPDKLTNFIENVGEMKTAVEALITGLEGIASQPLTISYDSKGGAEDALFGVLKNYISVSGGQVVLNYPE